MSTSADPQHITAVADDLREGLGGEPTRTATGAASPPVQRPHPGLGTDAVRRATRAAAWHHARRAAGRRDLQLLTAAAASAAAATALLRRD